MTRSIAQVCSTEEVGGWLVQHRRGTAAQLHTVSDIVGDRRLVQVNEVSRPSLVLGSTQGEDDVDRAALRSAGVELARRSSGGGAVLLRPGDHVWIDVVLPTADPLWSDDVTRSSWWLGERWVDALDELLTTDGSTGAAIGADGLTVHRHGLQGRELAGQVCFAGIGPGEVSLGQRKLVGLSQRRTRGWARFQCVVHRRWDPVATLELMRLRPERLEKVLRTGVAALEDGHAAERDVVGALLRQLC